MKVAFDAELWLRDARHTQSWTFVTLPASQSEEVRDLAGGLRRGFGSVPGTCHDRELYMDDVYLPR